MQITTRPATQQDAPTMARVLNDIIAAGGTTAFAEPISAQTMAGWITKDSGRASWQVAVNDSGDILGYQSAEPRTDLPPEAVSMASFVKLGCVGLGIGTAMFEAMVQRARALGYQWLNASILSDNDSGLRYYAKMGFTDWRRDPVTAQPGGRIAGKVHKRFDL